MTEKPGNTGGHSALLKQALRAVEQMKQKLDAADTRPHQPIAIIGIGCRFPGEVYDAASFWELLKHGREALSPVPPDRWDIDEFYDPDPSKPGKMVSRVGGFLTGIDLFDAGFFGIAPREATMMDPQQRLLLEVVWEALEKAGIAPRSLAGSRVGMYLGIASGDYGQMQLQAADPGLLDVHFASGNAHSVASGRLSYLLGLKGPSLSVDTACSSSLVAVHLACQALRARECSMAIAGGVNVILAPETTVALSQAQMMSPDGICRAFDERANGFVRAEGCGVVLLKPLDRAQADGDPILAVIRGTALNQDGASSSLTVPNGPSQEELMRRALEQADRTAMQVGYVEAHGTGTALGDPIELRALGSVYGASRKAGEPLLVGSLKTNFGHMEAAAGVGGLIKLVLALQHGEVPAHLHFETPTSHVPWDGMGLAVPRSTMPWPALRTAAGELMPRVGAVSSFGFSGTNAHLVVEQAPTPGATGHEQVAASLLLPLSARSSEALSAVIERYERWLSGPDAEEYDWAEIAATAASGRDHFRYRAALVASNKEEAAAALHSLVTTSDLGAASMPPSVCFLFTGQGSEHSGMGLDLLKNSAVFRAAVERLERALDGGLRSSIAAIWANEHGELEQASLVQPALYAYGWALFEFWRSCGVEPEAVLGHSLGEYVAATVAGVMTPEEGIRLVAARGRLTQELGLPGGMIAIVAGEQEVRKMLATSRLHRDLSVAAVNGPLSVVVSGGREAIQSFEQSLREDGVRHKRLRTTHGFHSAVLDAMLDAFETEAATISFRVPDTRWISNLTGQAVDRKRPIDARYWRRHLRQTVEFQAGLSAASLSAAGLFLEVGPEPQLLALAETNGIAPDRCVPSISKSGANGEWPKLLSAVAQIYRQGIDMDWRGITSGLRYRRVPLPTYPFQRQRFWFTHRGQQAASAGVSARQPGQHPLLGARLRTRSEAATFQVELTPLFPAHIGDHVVLGRRVLPGAAYLEMALAAVHQATGQPQWKALDVEFREPCFFDQPRLLETVIFALNEANGRRQFEIASTVLQVQEGESSTWKVHAAGFLKQVSPSSYAAFSLDLVAIQSRAKSVFDKDAFYERFQAAGLDFGPALQAVRQAWGNSGEGLVAIELAPEVIAESLAYGIHPIALDACLQAAAVSSDADASTSPLLPAALNSFHCSGDPRLLRFAHARKRDGHHLSLDIAGLDADGNCLLFAEGLRLMPRQHYRGWLHQVEWEPAVPTQSEPLLLARVSLEARLLIITARSVAEPGPLASSLSREAERNGAAVSLVSATEIDQAAIDAWFFEPPSSQAVSTFPRHIFYLPAAELTTPSSENTGVEALNWQKEVLGGALACTQALLSGDHLAGCRLWFVSRGAFGPEISSPDGATLAAFARNLRGEYPETRATAVDLSANQDSAQRLWRLAQENPDTATQLAVRGDRVWVPRLAPYVLPQNGSEKATRGAALEPSETRRLRFAPSGLLEDLEPATDNRRPPVSDELEIAIGATAINFHEVLSALEPGSAHGVPPGGECAGVVVRAGDLVSGLQAGDRVVAIGSGLMADFATLPCDRVWKIPHGITEEDAATLLIPFLTARWCFDRVARLQAGERVLIHAGAGGVGLAAIQEAKRLGALVYATAGSHAKREYLLSLGVEGVFDSRSTSFASGVLAETGFRGVDVVLNSLSGDKIAAGMRSLAPRGRFIELGEHTVLSDSEAQAFRPDVSYHRVHLRAALEAATPEVRGTIASILSDVAAGKISPLPWKRFALEDAAAAFRYVATGQHTGRVLLTPSSSTGRFTIRRDGAYVVTGGFSGLGRLTVQWLAKHGAGCVLTLARSEPDAETQQLFAQLQQKGTEIVAVRCDVSDEAGLTTAIDTIPPAFSLRGIFHAAAVLDDGGLPQQTFSRFSVVLAPKVAGGWNLHRLSRSAKLDCFVLFSSAAGVFGPRGQSNYAAANAYLDALAHYRRERLGLTALSVDWGAWSGTGAAVRHNVIERGARTGVDSIPPEEGFRILERLLEENCTQTIVSKVDWAKWAEHEKAEAAANADLLMRVLQAPKHSNAHKNGSPAGSDQATSVIAPAEQRSWRRSLEAAPQTQQLPMLQARVEERVRSVLRLHASQSIAAARPLQEYGLDSLLSIELRNALSSDLEVKLPVTTLFDYPTLASLMNYLFREFALDTILWGTGAVDEEHSAGERDEIRI